MNETITGILKTKSGVIFNVAFPIGEKFESISFTNNILYKIQLADGRGLFIQGNNIEYILINP